MNQNKYMNTVGVSDASTAPIPVANSRPDSVGGVESSIFEDNYETTIADYSLYSTRASIFTNGQLQCNVPMSNVDHNVELARG